MSEAAKSIHPPSAAFAAAAHVDAEAYAKRYAASIQDPEAFWAAEGLRLDWSDSRSLLSGIEERYQLACQQLMS